MNTHNHTATKTLRNTLTGIAGACAAALLLAAPVQAYEGGGHGGGGHGGFSGGHAGSVGHGSVGHGYYHGGYGRYRGWGGYHGWGCCGGFWGPGLWGFGLYGYWPYAGFGYYYDNTLAWPYVGLAPWDMPYTDSVTEADLRAQQNAIAQATAAPIDQAITWNNSDGSKSGSIMPVRDGHTADGRSCREFQQKITIDGKTQSGYGTACQQPDGAWQIVNPQ